MLNFNTDDKTVGLWFNVKNITVNIPDFWTSHFILHWFYAFILLQGWDRDEHWFMHLYYYGDGIEMGIGLCIYITKGKGQRWALVYAFILLQGWDRDGQSFSDRANIFQKLTKIVFKKRCCSEKIKLLKITFFTEKRTY